MISLLILKSYFERDQNLGICKPRLSFTLFPSRFTPLKHQNNGIKIVVQKFHLIETKEFIG